MLLSRSETKDQYASNNLSRSGALPRVKEPLLTTMSSSCWPNADARSISSLYGHFSLGLDQLGFQSGSEYQMKKCLSFRRVFDDQIRFCHVQSRCGSIELREERT